MKRVKEITPEGSIARVYLDTRPQAPVDEPIFAEVETAAALRSRTAAVAVLVAKLGLTEDEAKALYCG